jgi:hypothetical protein
VRVGAADDRRLSWAAPANTAFSRYCSLDAGLADVHVGTVQPTHCGSMPEKGLNLSTRINVADAVLAEGLASEDEVRSDHEGVTRAPELPGRTYRSHGSSLMNRDIASADCSS